ncbi:PREDICTED: uncharacterized protein LOC109192135 [Ipomoea nil]|uniref:uncharacterized protein LOC109192135 n=1 Tax=Ipomoea nil TaxID=35883 RepID=UPI000900E69A|nr:PREDICTED: uncharacterized protein LOC109192135 [Ipomoea nil]
MSASEYLGKAKMLVEALSLASHRLTLDEQVLYVLRGLRPEFQAMPSALTVTGTPVTLSQLGDLLQAHDFIQGDEFTMESGNVAPTAMYAGRGGQSNGSSGRGGRQNSNSRGRGRGGWNSGGRGRGSPRCQICRSHGHTDVFCNRCYTEPPPSTHAHVAVAGTPPAETAQPEVWFPDTGATTHVSPDEHMIGHSEPYTGGDVLKVGNGAGLNISRVGRTAIPSNSKLLNMSDVLFVPNLSLSLLSVYHFTNENNVFFEFHKDSFFVKDCTTREILLKGSAVSGLYKLLVPRSHVAFLTAKASPAVWHHCPSRCDYRCDSSSIPYFAVGKMLSTIVAIGSASGSGISAEIKASTSGAKCARFILLANSNMCT